MMTILQFFDVLISQSFRKRACFIHGLAKAEVANEVVQAKGKIRNFISPGTLVRGLQCKLLLPVSLLTTDSQSS